MSYGGYDNSGYGRGGAGGNPYGSSGGNPYGQQGRPAGNPYQGGPPSYNQQGGGRYDAPGANPYAQQDDRPGPQNGGYGGGGYGPYGGRQGQNDVELGQMDNQSGNYGAGNDPSQGAAGPGGNLGSDPNAILNECRDLDRGIDRIEANLEQLKSAQKKYLLDTDTREDSVGRREIQRLSSDTMSLYQNFIPRVRKIKSQPESGSPKNSAQVGRVDRRLKAVIQQYQQVDRDFRKNLNAASERQYRIVRPDASDAEVREAIENDPNQQIFSQALLQGDRRGQAQTVLRQVSDRHQMIQKIEQDMIQLAEMFQDLDVLVVQQEAAVVNIEQQGEQVTQDVSKANEEIAGAVVKARSRNRKKWWCLLIIVLIIIVIVIVVVVVVIVTRNAANAANKVTGG